MQLHELHELFGVPAAAAIRPGVIIPYNFFGVLAATAIQPGLVIQVTNLSITCP